MAVSGSSKSPGHGRSQDQIGGGIRIGRDDHALAGYFIAWGIPSVNSLLVAAVACLALTKARH
jgi:hypothetical protein